MKNIWDIFKIPEQKKASPFWGGIKDVLSRAMFYISIINFILIMVTAYHTSIKDIIPIPFWTFFIVLSTLLFVVMIFEYVIMLPSSVVFSNRQSYKHENPMRDDMNRILEKLDIMERRLDKLDNMEHMLISSGDDLKLLGKRLEPLEKRLTLQENDTSKTQIYE
jgi:BMFP domain-containing protein YqiC